MDSKTTGILVVAVVVGLLAGVGAGFVVFNNEEQTYWVYLNYGTVADDSHVSGWQSAKATSSVDALKKVADVDVEDGWIKTINGISPVWDDTKSEGFYLTTYIGPYGYGGGMVETTCTVSGLFSTCFMITFMEYDPVTYAPIHNVNVDAGYTGWMNTGPLAA